MMQTCEHPDTVVVYTDRECPLCQALADLMDAQQQTGLSDLCHEAIMILREGPFDEVTLQREGKRLSLELSDLLHDIEIREQLS